MGQKDIPLNDFGKKQAEILKPILKNLDFEYIAYSPLLRAHQTAEILFEDKKIFKEPIEELKEWNFGDWEGRIWDRLHLENVDQIIPPNGETKDVFFNRALQGINKAINRPESVLIVGHSGIYWAICHFAKIEKVNIDNCQIVQLNPSQDKSNWEIKIID